MLSNRDAWMIGHIVPITRPAAANDLALRNAGVWLAAHFSSHRTSWADFSCTSVHSDDGKTASIARRDTPTPPRRWKSALLSIRPRRRAYARATRCGNQPTNHSFVV